MVFFIGSQLPNYLFEEMAMDVFDEIDRRETENCEFLFDFVVLWIVDAERLGSRLTAM